MPLSNQELRQRLGITQRRLTEWIREGLPFTPAGRKKEFDAAAVAAWLQQTGKARPAAAAAAPTPPQVATTRAEASLLLDVNLRTLATWLIDPTFPGKAGSPGRQDGYFPIAEINAWREARFGADRRSGGPSDEVSSAKLRKTLIECDREQYEFERELKTILDYEETARLIARQIATAKALLEQMPDKVDSRLPAKFGPKTRRRVRRAIAEVLDETMQALAEMAAGDTDHASEDPDDDGEPADVPADAASPPPAQ